ncbi:hypothetical protein CHS0354_038434 [Potamilus streckersoni]|uniref:Uncharacterized protein n=1 Tax=Potamilus streckersoni TaxID=2493646 RepID=A0AAE0VPK9_9BIVA|nr:hypothetical protein CHS0354_038434 [Potamilus streckersoni]
MAQTFFGNAVTKMHPNDLFAGEAERTASILTTRNGYSFRDMYKHLDELQSELRTFMPICWDEPRGYTPLSSIISTPTSTLQPLPQIRLLLPFKDQPPFNNHIPTYKLMTLQLFAFADTKSRYYVY